MKVRNLYLLLGVLSLLALVTPSFAFAQSADRITKLDIQVWPEFDDPRVLVQYDGELAAQKDFPRQIAFYIPSTAVLTATAYQDESQQLLKTDPATVTDNGNGTKRVAFSVPKPHFHLEYYDDAIKGAPDKSFEFVYTALLPADSVQIQVQQPLKAENFKTVPAAALISDGMHDFKYHIFNYPGAAADQALKLQVSYTKTDPNPSIQNVVAPTPASQDAAQTAPQAAAADTALAANPQQVYLFAAAGIVLALGLLALWMWYTRRQPALAFAGASKPTGRKPEQATGFCSQCGNPLHGGDNFCPKCGAKRK